MKLQVIPYPASVRPSKGVIKLQASSVIILSQRLPSSLMDAVFALSACLKEQSVNGGIYIQGRKRVAADGDIQLSLRSTGAAESYQIKCAGNTIQLTGHGPAGLFYAIQTFIQLIRQYGIDIPCMEIRDTPTFAHRGYYLDITRGKVPRMATLKRVIDRLSALKYNQLQLYVEHTYDFRFDPDIARKCSALTSNDILELDRYCRDRFIDFVPSMTCFGHLGRILSLPAYRDLAEVEFIAPSWEKATWRQRMTGATLNPRKPGAKRLIQKMLDEYLALFSSGYFNACCDETYDLGRGPNSRLAKEKGVGYLFSQHIQFLQKTTKRYDKRLMFWGDVLQHHPKSIKDIPSDCIALDWGYESTTPFAKAAHFIEHGLETYVCPSVRGYGVVFNQTEKARGNITGYARTGAELGATGLLTTDWGDLGHFNMYACSLHGMALGAAMGWNPKADATRDFDKAFSLQFFGMKNNGAAAVYKSAGNSPTGSWPFFINDLPGEREQLLTERVIEKAREQAFYNLQRLEKWKATHVIIDQDLQELQLACKALILNADKYMLARYMHGESSCSKPGFRKKCQTFATQLDDYFEQYAGNWRNANRESALVDIQKTFKRLAKQVRTNA